MAEIVRTMKLHIHPTSEQEKALCLTTEVYRRGCNLVSEYIFGHDFELNSLRLQKVLYASLREDVGLKSQMAISCIKTATARYKTVQTQLKQHPYKYKDEDNKWQSIPKTLEWLQKPVLFSRPQADLVRGRDYSFVGKDKAAGQPLLSLNTLEGRITVPYEAPAAFAAYFAGGWEFGAGKLVSLKGKWYFHIPMTKEIPDEAVFDRENVRHVVGIDRGLRFLATTYDEKGRAGFISGKGAMKKRAIFQNVRDELQAKGTKSAKRALKRISGRENRWMSDVNHRISKTLVSRYGEGTLFVLEDLTDVTFNEENLSSRNADGRRNLRSWAFYQLEQFLTYKAEQNGSMVLKVDADYTSQRCPKCGKIRRENRDHKHHAYVCDCCGYRSNDDRIGAMNIQTLGTLYISGDEHPTFRTGRKRASAK
ncbi:MAG: RNA-guided endonuclease TnpB family protein [Chordicoccus sp.]